MTLFGALNFIKGGGKMNWGQLMIFIKKCAVPIFFFLKPFWGLES